MIVTNRWCFSLYLCLKTNWEQKHIKHSKTHIKQRNGGEKNVSFLGVGGEIWEMSGWGRDESDFWLKGKGLEKKMKYILDKYEKCEKRNDIMQSGDMIRKNGLKRQKEIGGQYLVQ